MNWFSEPNEDARTVSPDAVSTGPLVGFLGAFDTAVQQQMRTSSMYGIEYYMHEADAAQTRALRDAGVADAPNMLSAMTGENTFDAQSEWRDGGYLDVAKRENGETVDTQFASRVDAYDERVRQLQTQYPDLGIKTSKEMFADVRQRAQDIERREANENRTWGGAAGGFLGAAVASLHPSTDPLNFATTPVGGLGRTAATRILMQGGAQGAVEGLNQLTGVQEQRGLLGLSTGAADAISRIAGAAVGGAALQGAGEALGAVARRAGWFRSTPADPAPAPEALAAAPPPAPVRPRTPDEMVDEARTARLETDGAERTYVDIIADDTPLSGTKLARPRVASDLNDFTRQLDDWTAGPAAGIRPRTTTAVYPGDVPLPRVDTRAAVDSNARYQAAKAVDPDVFAKYEKLQTRVSSYRKWLGELGAQQNTTVAAVRTGIEARLDALETELRTTQGKNAKAKVRAQIAEVKADRESAAQLSAATETRDMAQVRRALMQADEQMRELAPSLGRAYARADGKWNETPADIAEVWASYRAGRVPQPQPDARFDPDTLITLAQRVPALRRAPVDAPADKPAVDVVRDVIAEEVKVYDEALAAYRASVRLTLAGEDNIIRVAGSDHEFNIDTDKVFMADGREVTIREMMEDMDRMDQELEAMTTCSIR